MSGTRARLWIRLGEGRSSDNPSQPRRGASERRLSQPWTRCEARSRPRSTAGPTPWTRSRGIARSTPCAWTTRSPPRVRPVARRSVVTRVGSQIRPPPARPPLPSDLSPSRLLTSRPALTSSPSLPALASLRAYLISLPPRGARDRDEIVADGRPRRRRRARRQAHRSFIPARQAEGASMPQVRVSARGRAVPSRRREALRRARARVRRAPRAAGRAPRGRAARGGQRPGDGGDRRHVSERRGAFYTLVPIRPRSRGGRRSLRTFPGASLRPGSLAFNPRPRRLSTSTDAYELHPDVRLYRTALTPPPRTPPPRRTTTTITTAPGDGASPGIGSRGSGATAPAGSGASGSEEEEEEAAAAAAERTAEARRRSRNGSTRAAATSAAAATSSGGGRRSSPRRRRPKPKPKPKTRRSSVAGTTRRG